MFTKDERSNFDYWAAHLMAFNMTALNCKCWRFKYLFHDIEKPFLKLFLPYKKVQRWHRNHNNHHPEWLEYQISTTGLIEEPLNNFDYEAAIIDWECGHYTKIAQPRHAFEEYKKIMEPENVKNKYPHIYTFCYDEFSRRLMNVIIKLGLNND